MKTRKISKVIREDLDRKMVFLGGPRQVGKTTLSKSLLKQADSGLYLNWDQIKDRQRILNQSFPDVQMLVFDEIHKFARWRNFLKGYYDTRPEGQKIIVTGSARLDLLRKTGDSLQGRYHYHRLLPLSVAELGINSQKDLMELFELSGFPEPFYSSSQRFARRWSNEYHSRLVYEDLGSLDRLQDMASVELLQSRLPALVMSPLSINALREDLQVNHRSVARWLLALEKVYSFFRISPLGAVSIKAVTKEQKHYHYDWTLCDSHTGARFENMIAVHLLKWMLEQIDQEGRHLELRYYKETTDREVDFVVLEKGKPILAVECKQSDVPISKTLGYLKSKFPKLDCWQIYLNGSKDFTDSQGLRLAPALRFLQSLS